MQTTFLKVLILLFYVHSLLNKSIKMPVLYINTQFSHSKFQEFRHLTENPAKNYRRKEQTTVYLFERSIVHNTAASQASRLTYSGMQMCPFLLLLPVHSYMW